MKKTILLLILFNFCILVGFSQSWKNTFYQYNSPGYSNSFQLSNDDCLVYTYSQGQQIAHTVRTISPQGYVLSEKTVSNSIPSYYGFDNRIYSFSGQIAYILNKQFDTISYHTGLPVGIKYFIESNKIINDGVNITCLDTNLTTLWTKTIFTPQNYQSQGVNYTVEGDISNLHRDVNGDIIHVKQYMHYDPNFNLNPDTATIFLLRINKNTGATIDSMFIGLNYPTYFIGGDYEFSALANNKIRFFSRKLDQFFNPTGEEYFQINTDFSAFNKLNTQNNNFASFANCFQTFQGLNNSSFSFKNDSIYSHDINFNVLNSWRLNVNNYRILKIDTVQNGYIFKIIDYDENKIKFIRTDNSFQFVLCNSNPIMNENYSVCQVTVESNNCRVIWEESGSNNIVGYNIYRENSFGSYDSLSYIPVDSLSEYLDLTSNPNQFSHKYKITYFDTCFRESPLSNFHKTIHLTANVGVNNEVNLIWTPYVGTNYNTYYIYRGTSPNNLTVLDSVSNSISSYTDFSAPAGINLYYEIVIQPLNTCTSTKALYSSIKSNTKSTVETNSIESLSVNGYDIYPNPTDEKLHIVTNNLNNEPFTLFDIMGVKIAEGQLTESHSIISMKEFSSGSYLLFIGNNNSPRRIVKQ
jgi:hypothetical protein